MKTITIKEGCSTPVCLGEKGENGVGAVLFDYSEWLNDFGNGAISLLVKRKGDTSAYPVVLSTADGIATWTISDTDTAVQGYGKAEYIFTIDDKVAKSAVFSFFVAHDLGPAGDPPDPYESWIDTLTALGGETLINAQAAETAATNAESSATAAAQSAGAARFAAESALASADTASASATTATASATAASASATQAAASASAAEASETAAYESANTAAEEAEVARTAAAQAEAAESGANTAATEAEENATIASNSATIASGAATTATNAATSATTSANNASQSASAASGSATAAASSATNAAASATAAQTAQTGAEAAQSAAESAQAAAEEVLEYIPADYSELSEDVDNLKGDLNSVATGEPKNNYLDFQIGYLHGLPNYTPANPGQNTANNTICGTDYVSVAIAKELFFDSANYNLCIVYYDTNKTYQTYVGFVSSPNPYILDTQYAYFVPELRKKDAAAFTDPSVADGTVYYSYLPNMDIVRHTELSGAVDNIEQEIESIDTKKLIQPEILPTLPYKVERTPNGYLCEEPDLTGFITIYVDPVNGDDNDTGLDGYPVKTLARGLYRAQKQMQNNSKSVILNLADESVFYVDDLPASWGVAKSFVLRANNNATLIVGKKPTFTASGNHYVSEALTAYTIIGCVDMSDTDDYGIFKTMNVVSSENAVEDTDNSYYIDTANKIVYVHPSSSIDDIVVVFSNTYACNLAAYSIDESAVIMAENIRFVGNSTVSGRSSSTVGETLVRTFYAKNCIFEHGFSNNAVSFNDFDYTYVVDCVAGYAKLDCFNYHFTRKPTPTNALIVEVNCKAKESGYYNSSDASDNLTTSHDGSNILRCGCHGYNGNGPLCADVNGCYSVCLDCNFINTSYTDKPAGVNKSAYRFDNAQASRDGKTILQNCFGYDSRNNRLVNAVDLTLNGVNAGGAIEATSIKVGKELI